MKYLKITSREMHNNDDLYRLVWPTEFAETAQLAEDDALLNTFIMNGEMHMIPATHPNMSFILLCVENPDWYDDEIGPYKFIIRT